MSRTSVATTSPDSRNLQWRSSNVGAKLMQKMGWKDGQAVGKRQRSSIQSAADDGGEAKVSSEGLRVAKRQDGLGIGARASSLYEAPAGSGHPVDHFSSVLSKLQSEHGSSATGEESSSSSSKKKKKKDKKKRKRDVVVMPTNKRTHHKVRQAKFQTKTQEEMQSIFIGSTAMPVVSGTSSSSDERRSEKKKRIKSKKDKKRKS